MDLDSPLAGAALIAAFPVLMRILTSVLAPDGYRAADLFKAPIELGWPCGVQEEEPVRWHVEVFGSATSADPGPVAARLNPVVSVGAAVSPADRRVA